MLSDVLSEGVTRPSGVHSPACAVIGVGPEQVAHGALMGNFLESLKGADVVECFDAGGQSSMQAEELVLNDCGEWNEIEKFSQTLPDVGVAVLAAALIVEAVNLGDLS